MKEILKFIKPHRARLLIVALMHTLATVCSLLMPYVMSKIVDDGIAMKQFDVILISAALLGVLALLSLIASAVSNHINAGVTTHFSASVCRTVFGKINSLSPEQFSRIGSSGLLTRSTDDVFNMEGMASEFVYTVVTVPMMLIGGAVMAFLSDFYLALVFVCFIPIALLFVGFIVRPLYKLWDTADKYMDTQNKIIRERLSGLRVIRAFNREQREHDRAKHATEEMSKHIIKANVRSGFITPVVLLILNVATVVMLWVGAVRADAGAISASGGVIAAIQYVTLVSNAMLVLSWTIAWIPHLRVSIKRITEVLSLPKEDEGAEDIDADKISAAQDGVSVELRGVSFTYPDSSAPALSSIDFSASAGESVAVIGGTGSGKTTLVRLLLDFYSPSSGSIFVDGRNYGDMKLSEVRSHYSAALQRGMIFEGTIRDNVLMGKSDAEDSEIMSVAADCSLSDFIQSKEEGLDYLLVGMGQNVSGGQKQRVNLCRTVLRAAPVYIFDDSFSALDYLTESKIRRALEKRLRGKTRIFMTQRISTALSADRIYVMDRGEIVGVGTHGELVKECETYREICLSQLGADFTEGGDA